MRMRILPLALASLTLPLGACADGCAGAITVVDPFEVADDPTADSLHTYASDAAVPLTIRYAATLFAPRLGGVTTDGSISLDPAETVDVTATQIKCTILTGEPGTGTLFITDEGGATLDSRELEVVDADALTLDVTSPSIDGVTLPALDPTTVRIYAGSKAAFRTTLLREGTEIFGTRAVAITPADASVGFRRATACSEESCDESRSAAEISVPDTTTAPVEVVLSAGTASVTIVVVPTVDADIDSLTLDSQNGEHDGKQTTVAHVQANSDAVFGAPVAWTFDGAALEGTGDALRTPYESGASAPITAAIGDESVSGTVESSGGEAEVTSITAACGQGASSTLGAFALVLLLVARRRAFAPRF